MNLRGRLRLSGKVQPGRVLALRRFFFRAVVSLITGLPAILFAALIIPSFRLTSFGAALLGLIVLSGFNAILRPLLVRLTLPINILTAGLFTLLIDGFIISIIPVFVAGWQVESVWTGIAVSFILTIAQMLIANTIVAGDDRDLYFYQMVQRYTRKEKQQQRQFDSPGMILLELDGLSEPILRRVLADGRMPRATCVTSIATRVCRIFSSTAPTTRRRMRARRLRRWLVFTAGWAASKRCHS